VVAWTLAAAGLQAIAFGLIRVSVPAVRPTGFISEASVGLQAVRPPGLIGPAPAVTSALPLASVRGLVLEVPGSRVVAVGYHEAAVPDALALYPSGRCVRDANRTKFVIPKATAGPDYIVMSSRGRSQTATSAVDVAIAAGSRVLSPVTGQVIRVKRYYLYGRYLDYEVDILPSGHSKLRVVIIHLDRVTVRRFGRVVAALTPIGKPRVFPFDSQINDYIGPGVPHVHIEVKELGP